MADTETAKNEIILVQVLLTIIVMLFIWGVHKHHKHMKHMEKSGMWGKPIFNRLEKATDKLINLGLTKPNDYWERLNHASHNFGAKSGMLSDGGGPSGCSSIDPNPYSESHGHYGKEYFTSTGNNSTDDIDNHQVAHHNEKEWEEIRARYNDEW